MQITLNLTDDQVDAAVIQSLKEAYAFNFSPNKIDCSDDVIPVDQEFLDAVDLVLEYYLNYEQIKEWVKEKRSLHLDELAKTDGELL